MLDLVRKIVRSRWFIALVIILLCVAFIVTITNRPEETKQAVEKLVGSVTLASVVAAFFAVGGAGFSIYQYLKPKEMGWNNKNYELSSNNLDEFSMGEKTFFYPLFDEKKRYKDVTISEKAKENARFFRGIGNGKDEPGLPYYAKIKGTKGGGKILIPNNPYVTGFQGTAENDLASIFHLVVIPKNKVGDDNKLVGLRNEELIPAHVGELNENHLRMLADMKQAALTFFEENKEKLYERFGKEKVDDAFKSGIRLGFHLEPSIGYLHLHALLGNLTKSGIEEHKKWISIDDAITRAQTSFDENGNFDPNRDKDKPKIFQKTHGIKAQ